MFDHLPPADPARVSDAFAPDASECDQEQLALCMACPFVFACTGAACVQILDHGVTQ